MWVHHFQETNQQLTKTLPGIIMAHRGESVYLLSMYVGGAYCSILIFRAWGWVFRHFCHAANSIKPFSYLTYLCSGLLNPEQGSNNKYLHKSSKFTSEKQTKSRQLVVKNKSIQMQHVSVNVALWVLIMKVEMDLGSKGLKSIHDGGMLKFYT